MSNASNNNTTTTTATTTCTTITTSSNNTESTTGWPESSQEDVKPTVTVTATTVATTPAAPTVTVQTLKRPSLVVCSHEDPHDELVMDGLLYDYTFLNTSVW